MGKTDHDAQARRILELAGFGQYVSEDNEEGAGEVSIQILLETEEFDILKIVYFLLGTREEKGNLFRGSSPSQPDSDVILLKANGREQRYLFFLEERGNHDVVSIGMSQIDPLGEEEEEKEVIAGENDYHVDLRRKNIVNVRFEIIEGKCCAHHPASKLLSIVVENEGGYFVRINDNGFLYVVSIDDEGEDEEPIC